MTLPLLVNIWMTGAAIYAILLLLGILITRP